jgi:hypothetical protein
VRPPTKTGIGKVEGWATPEKVLDAIPDVAHVSAYISPYRQSGTVHRVKEGAFVCLPNVPLGRVERRPEYQRPTCGRCLNAN